MLSKKDLEARGRTNPYGLTQKQLDDLEVTKAQVAKHLNSIDFSKHNSQTSNPEIQKQAETIYRFTHLINKTRRK